MALISKIIANLTATGTSGTVDTTLTPTSQTAKGYLIKSVTLFSQTGSQTVTVSLYVKQGSTQQNCIVKQMLAGDSIFFDKEITLNANSTTPDYLGFSFVCSATVNIQCVVNGIERDQ